MKNKKSVPLKKRIVSSPVREKQKLPVSAITSRQKISLISLSFLLILLIEGVCRLAHYGGYPPVFLSLLKKSKDIMIYGTNPASIDLFFLAKAKGHSKHTGGKIELERLLVPKPKNELRIMYVGESTVQGYPFRRNLGSAAFLSELLKEALPDKQINVINLGISASASFPVMKITQQAINYNPDVVVIYTGHNEYFGAFGVASLQSVGTKEWQMNGMYWFRSLGIVQAMIKFMDYISNYSSQPEPAYVDLFQVMPKINDISIDSKLREDVLRNLHTHIQSMIQSCKIKNIPVVLCTEASNERDMAPLRSPDMNILSTSNAKRWKDNYTAGLQELSLKKPDAVGYLQLASQVFPQHGLTHFYYAKALEIQGDTTRALQEYCKARDLDEMPWRAAETTNQMIRNLAQNENIWLNDVEEKFHQVEPLGIGWRLMADHLHPSLEGQVLLAQTIFSTLSSHHWENLDQSGSRITTDWKILAQKMGYNPMEEFIVTSIMEGVWQRPPFRDNNENTYTQFSSNREAIIKSGTSIDQQVIQQGLEEWHNKPTPPDFSYIAATAYYNAKMYKKAQEYFHAVWLHFPDYTLDKYDFANNMLNCSKLVNNKLTEEEIQLAKENLEDAKSIAEGGNSPELTGKYNRVCGLFLQLLEDHLQAIQYFDKSLPYEKGVDRQETAMAMAESYQALHQLDKAKKILEQELSTTSWNGPEMMLKSLENSTPWNARE